MSLFGKGFFIWKIRDCEGGNPAAIADAAQAAGLTHVLLKIADATYPNNVDPKTNIDLVPPVAQALRSKKITVWGWHYVYGNNPLGEANIAIRRVQECELEGYVIDAEHEYKEPGKANAARRFMDRLRENLPNLPIALSSYRFPSYHPQLPWKAFLEKCDLNMPQVYWEKAHNPGPQLSRCVREFEAMEPYRPVFPTGPAYKAGGWAPTVEDTKEFLDQARTLKLAGANFFSWDICKKYMPPIWDAVANYAWDPIKPPQDVASQFISALNTHDPARVTALYHDDAVHITFARAVQGNIAIRSWYSTIFDQLLPAADFKLTGSSGTGNSRHITWTAESTKGSVKNGNDTIGLMDGKIAYHYSFFTISS